MGRNRSKNTRAPVGWLYGARSKRTGMRAIYFRGMNAGDRAIVLSITGKANCLRLSATDDPAGHNEAARVYALEIVARREKEETVDVGTVGELCHLAEHGRGTPGTDGYLPPFLASIQHPKTRKERTRHLLALNKKFGARRYALNVYEASKDTRGTFLRGIDVQRHIFGGRETRKVSVNREVRSWELLFQWARAAWGFTEYNPCSGLIENDEKSRRVVPEDDDIFKLYRWLDPPARFMVAIIRYYGRRKVEQLGLQLNDVREDGVHFRRAKDEDGRPIILKWDPRLRRMVARLQRWRAEVIRPTRKNKAGRIRKAPAAVSTALIINRRGRAYSESGFNTARKRAMKRAGIAGAFTFHDMRKSRAESLETAEEAQNVLAHDELRTTKMVYRPNAPIVVDLNDEVARKRKAK